MSDVWPLFFTLFRHNHSVLPPPPSVKGGFSWAPYLKIFRGRERGNTFYDPKIEICKIKYCENVIKWISKETVKIMLMKSRKLFSLFTSFSFSLNFQNFLKTEEQGCNMFLDVTRMSMSTVSFLTQLDSGILCP